MNRHKRSYFFDTPQASGYNKFSKLNEPTQQTFLELFQSIPFIGEVNDTAQESVAGHVRKATALESFNRSVIAAGNHTKVVLPHQLPDIVLTSSADWTAGVSVENQGLKLTPLTHDATGRKDFLLQLQFKNSIESDSNSIQLKNDSETPGNSKYYGTNSAGTKGWHTFTSDTSVKVAGDDDTDADTLSSTFFKRYDATTHIVPKLSEDTIWVGKLYAAGVEYPEEIATKTAFNKDFGYTTSDIVEIGTNLVASQVVLTNSDKKLYTEEKKTGFNKNFGTTSGTVSEGNHTHGSFSTTVAGFVPAPGSAVGKFLMDDGTWQSPSGMASSYKVMADSGDGTPGYLEDKVDGTTIEVNGSNNLQIVDNGVDFTQIDTQVIQRAVISIDSAELLALYTNPKTIVTCPALVGSDSYFIKVVDWFIQVFYSTAAYATNTKLLLKCSGATDEQGYDEKSLISTVNRSVSGALTTQASSASSSQLVGNADLVLTTETGNPTAGGGSIRVVVYYRVGIITGAAS